MDFDLFLGIGLVFIVYPEILSTFRFPQLFAIVFFLMLIMLGMDSAFGGMEGLYTAIIDEYPICKRHAFVTRYNWNLLFILQLNPNIPRPLFLDKFLFIKFFKNNVML